MIHAYHAPRRGVTVAAPAARRPGEFLKQLKKSKRPVLLAVKGKAAAIVQDPASYQPGIAGPKPASVRSTEGAL